MPKARYRAYRAIYSAIILKGHTSARGEVDLNGNSIQDPLYINKNLLANAAGVADYTALREAMKAARAVVANTPLVAQHISVETWPGAAVKTDAQLDAYNRVNAWGHHACCTAKIGKDGGEFSTSLIRTIADVLLW